MSASTAQLARRTLSSEPLGAADRRRHLRVPLVLLGRFMRQSRHEYPCKLIDISVGGAAMISPVALEADERIVAYFDRIGGLEGHVARTFDGGFAMRIAASQHKREKLAAQLTWIVNQTSFGDLEARRHERTTGGPKPLPLKLDDGSVLDCRLLDVSLSGASVETIARPAIGTPVGIGRLRAKVVRYHEHGLGLQFVDIQQPDAIRGCFGQ